MRMGRSPPPDSRQSGPRPCLFGLPMVRVSEPDYSAGDPDLWHERKASEMGNSSPPNGTTICGSCGSSNRPGARFCLYCGSALQLAPSHPIGSDVAPISLQQGALENFVDTRRSDASSVSDTSALATSVSARCCPSGHEVGPTARYCGQCGSLVADKADVAVTATETRSAPEALATARVPAVPMLSSPPVQSMMQPDPASRSRTALWFIAGIALVVVLALVGGLTYYLSSRNQSRSALSNAAANESVRTRSTSGASTNTNAAGSLPSTSGTDTAQSEATALNSLISSSAAARSGVQPAYNDIDGCTDNGGNLLSDDTTLQQAATTRQSLLSQLQQLDVSQLPQSDALVQYLISAWSESISADQSFAAWAQDEINAGCTQQDHGDPNWISGNSASAQADADKNNFTQIWNSTIATTYNVGQWQTDQI